MVHGYESKLNNVDRLRRKRSNTFSEKPEKAKI